MPLAQLADPWQKMAVESTAESSTEVRGERGGAAGKVVKRRRDPGSHRPRRSRDGQSFPSRAGGREEPGDSGPARGRGAAGRRAPGPLGVNVGACRPAPARRFLSGALTHGRDRLGLPRAGTRGVFHGTGLLPARSLPFRPLLREGVTCFCGGRLGRFCSSAVSGYCHGEFSFPGRPRRLRQHGPGGPRPALTLPGALALPRLSPRWPRAIPARVPLFPYLSTMGLSLQFRKRLGNRRDVSHG